MKKIVLFCFYSLVFSVGFAQENIWTKQYIKAIADKVNNYQYSHPWTEEDNNWIRGTYYTGVLSIFQTTGDKLYLEQCNKWGEKHKWKIPKLKPEQQASGANLLTCAQTWLESYLIEKKEDKIAPVITHLEDSTVRNPVSMPLYWYYESGIRYVDGLFTGPPTLAILYKITGNEKYLDWMDACFWDIYGKLFDIDEGLFFRDIRYMPGYIGKTEPIFLRPDSIPYEKARRSYVYQQTKNNKKVIWSRGNGWALAGLARILKYLPQNHANYERYKAVFVQMAYSLQKHQQSDGFWYPNLADPKDYGTTETSGTGFFTYGLAWGINNGILPKNEFFPVIKKSWEALVSTVSNEGKVQYGQLVGSSPYTIFKKDSHEYVTGAFLLAASEIYMLSE